MGSAKNCERARLNHKPERGSDGEERVRTTTVPVPTEKVAQEEDRGPPENDLEHDQHRVLAESRDRAAERGA